MKPGLRVVWAYDNAHLKHPFIKLALGSLKDAGFEVTIIASDRAENSAYHSYDAFKFPSLERVVYFEGVERREYNLLYLSYDKNARDYKYLAKKYWQKGNRNAALGALWQWLSWRLRARYVLSKKQFLGHWRKIDSHGPNKLRSCIAGFFKLVAVPSDVIVATRPQAAICAWLAATVKRRRLVYYPFELYGDQSFAPSRWLLGAEQLILRYGIDSLITQNEHRAGIYRRERGARVEPSIVHNYKPAASMPSAGVLKAQLGLDAKTRIVLYQGVLIEGRHLENVARSAAFLPPDVVMVLMGRGSKEWLKGYEETIAGELASGRVFLLPPVTQEELLSYVVDADVGIIIYDGSVRNNLYCEPGKLSDYIFADVPVVAPPFPTIQPVVEGYDIGISFESSSPQKIAEAITAVLQRPKQAWQPGLERARRELVWERQVPTLLAAVTGAQRSAAGSLE
jgi:glycosyltransferase involved in cell wall biosynthesis